MMSDDTPQTSKLNFGATGTTAPEATPAADVAATPVTSAESPAEAATATDQEVKAAEINNAVENGQQSAPAEIADKAVDAAAKVAGIDTDPKVEVKAPAVVGEAEDVAALEAQQKALADRIAEQKKAQQASVIAQIKTVVDQYNIPVADLVEALGGLKRTRKSSGTVKPKYKDPNSDKTWTGRGKEPLWIKGQDKTKFLITE